MIDEYKICTIFKNETGCATVVPMCRKDFYR